ncbi:HD-GYP domain-containing protein [Methylogaea oryzae]|uniref:HD-GYP domain-containing protein n=1 Tax=Methylogaea oryzae TaxID=1295382 RepID=UPI0009E85681|nr:HD-GYP domain-containing protein [Methylogaea oryzae]
MIKRFPVEQLQVGMYVCRIERGWVDTSFWSDGRTIDSEAELCRLRECCQYVYVDTAKGSDRAKTPTAPASNVDGQGDAPQGSAAALYRHSYSVLEEVFEDARLGGSIDGNAARAVVRDLTLSVLADSNALLCLTSLKDKHDSLARKSVNVCILTLAFGKAIGIPKATLHDLGLGALLHDVGMLQVPDEILHKTDKMSAEERAVLEKHVLYGLRMLAASRACSESVLKIVHCHHEWVDGSGYPQGLKANASACSPAW